MWCNTTYCNTKHFQKQHGIYIYVLWYVICIMICNIICIIIKYKTILYKYHTVLCNAIQYRAIDYHAKPYNIACNSI